MSLMIGLPVQFFLQNILQSLAPQRQQRGHRETRYVQEKISHWLTRDINNGRIKRSERWDLDAIQGKRAGTLENVMLEL
jgi:hypothetical protein